VGWSKVSASDGAGFRESYRELLDVALLDVARKALECLTQVAEQNEDNEDEDKFVFIESARARLQEVIAKAEGVGEKHAHKWTPIPGHELICECGARRARPYDPDKGVRK